MDKNVNEVKIDEDSTAHLPWFSQSKSKDAEYLTQIEVADAIFEVFKPHLKPNHFVIDITAGSGRLLKPFKKAGSSVFAVEFKESLAQKLKHNIGKDNVRVGDIRDYYSKIRNANLYNSFDISVCNPPYGLKWDANEVKGLYSSDGIVESQFAVLEMLTGLVKTNGIVALIIPTSTWSNTKDIKFINHIFDNYNILHLVTLQKGFKKEYNLNILTDIVFMKKVNKYGYNHYRQTMNDVNKHVLSIENISDLKDIVTIELTSPYFDSKEQIKDMIQKIPKLDTLSTFEESEYKLDIGVKGITGNESMLSLLDFYDETRLEHYNPVMGKPTGIKECYFSLPSLIKIGVEPVQKLCEEIGFDLQFSDINKKKFAKLKKKWDFESTPLYKPKSHELLAYYELKKYKAKETLIQDGKTIFIKDKEYLIKPTWIRNNQVVEETELTDAKGKKTGEIETKSLESGYLTLEVQSETGTRAYAENNLERIEEFLSVFNLPDVKGIAELYPERVRNWANVLAKHHSYLYDWQAEDVARVLCKRNGYIGHQMGGGKTISAFAYASSRQYQRVLIVCQGSLVDNWLHEANKFGFKIAAIRSHSDIARLKQRIKNKDFQRHTTEFFVVGQEFLSLDGGKIYNEWTCTRRNKDGVIIHNELCTKGKCSEGHKYEVMHKVCPSCNAEYSEGWTGRYCNKCGYRPYSYGQTAHGRGMKQYPAYKLMKKLFSCVITDESQNFAKRSLRGEASRTFKSKSKLMLTGTIMKNYVEDVFLNFGWLLGYENPIYYFNRRDTRRFLDEFGSYEVISRSYLKEMGDASYRKRQGGRKKLLPAVSNLNRFWKMISPFTVRRLSEDVAELKIIERARDYHNLDMDPEHYNLYLEYEEWAKKVIDRELRKEGENQNINLGVISNCLWKLRYVANCPINPALIIDDNKGGIYPNKKLDASIWNKPEKVLELVKDAKMKGDKAIVFSGLRFVQGFMANFLKQKGFKVKYIGAHVNTKKRFNEIKDFEENYDVLVTGNNVLNRGYTIVGANHVIFCDFEYTPEVTDQAEFRCIRPGQEKKVQIHYIISNESIDEQMKETCDQKRKAIKSAIDKKNEHADITELMKQADFRSPEMKIARDIHKKVTPKKKALVQREVMDVITDDSTFDEFYKDFAIKLNKDFIELAETKPKKKERYQMEFDFGFDN